MITIRNRTMQTVAKGPAQDIIPTRSALVPLERLDFYPSTPEGPAVLGVSWQDGSSGICDWLIGAECRQWLAEATKTWAAGKVRVHLKHGRAVHTVGLAELQGLQS